MYVVVIWLIGFVVEGILGIIPFVAHPPVRDLVTISSPIQGAIVTDSTIQDSVTIGDAHSNMCVTYPIVGSDTPCSIVQNTQEDVVIREDRPPPPKEIITPVRPLRLAHYLDGYQSVAKAKLVSGFTYGFHINSMSLSNVVSHKNLKSARLLPHVVDSKVAKEVELGRYSGPYKVSPYESSIVSPLGVREKKTPGEYRLIHNLSYPYDETSVNASIPREFAQVKYASIDHAVKLILDKGRYCFLAKSDIKSAFRIIPVHPDDRHLLGVFWNGCYYYDNCLPMDCLFIECCKVR